MSSSRVVLKLVVVWNDVNTTASKRPRRANIDEVPKFSFDIFLKYNPICNPLIRNFRV